MAEGNVGAGAGATVGKLAGAGRAMKGGIGSASIALPSGLIVGAIAAVNAAGDVIDPATGKVLAGVRTEDGKTLADARLLIRSGALARTAAGPRAGGNTTIAIVATNARLSKAEISRVALMADDALARTINPSHTTGDGDTVFALATSRWTGEASVDDHRRARRRRPLRSDRPRRVHGGAARRPALGARSLGTASRAGQIEQRVESRTFVLIAVYSSRSSASACGPRAWSAAAATSSWPGAASAPA